MLTYTLRCLVFWYQVPTVQEIILSLSSRYSAAYVLEVWCSQNVVNVTRLSGIITQETTI